MRSALKVLLAASACALVLGACDQALYKGPPTSTAPAVEPPMDTQPLETVSAALGTNLIANGDFEAGALTSWSTYGSYKYVVTSPKHAGSYAARLGSTTGSAGTSYIYQTVAIPAGGATLTFWWYPVCYDSITYDQQWVEIHSTSGALLKTIVNACNNSAAWAQITSDLSAYAGTSVQVRFGLTEDGYSTTDETYYYLDDVSVVANGGGTNDFSVSVSPSSQSVLAGSNVSYTVSTAVTSGSAQTVSLAVSGLPAGVTGSFNPASVTAGGSSTLTLTAASSAAAATATFTVTGTATSGSHTATASVTVTTTPPANDFSVSVSPSSQSVAAGSSVPYTVSTAVTSGSAQTVSLAVSGLPSGVTGSFSPASVTAGSSSTLTLTAASSAAAATATFTVTGSATSGSHTATASVTVTTVSGGIGPNGGSVDHLYFAAVGDTRPGSLDATASYPTAIVNKIYQDINVLSPKPQFVAATGDFMYASTTGGQAATQIGYYKTATQYYSGTTFTCIGNHECDGYTADNCTLGQTDNINQYMSAMVTPLGKGQPYYTINITSTTPGAWTAKVINIACNVWSTTQKTWLQQQLATSTTYTIVLRHMPASATTGPCVSDTATLLGQYPYNLLLVGHTHTFSGSSSSKQIIIGNGGAPQTAVPYGFATIEKVSTGWQIKQYDYSTNSAVNTFTVP